MSNDAHQLVDEISSASKEMEEWVVNIVAQLDSSVISDPTEQLRTDINNKKKPSIFIDSSKFSYFRQVYFFDDTDAWKYVAFMRRWFDLNLCSYLEDIQEKEDLALDYYQGLDWDQGYRKLFLEYLLINSCILVFAILSYQNVWNEIGIISATKEKMTDPGIPEVDQRSIECYTLYQHFLEYPKLNKLLMLTMNNQIPWFVVEALYTKHSNLSKLVGTPIDKLAFSCFDDLYPGVHKSKVNGGTGTLPPGGFKHLLHIFHWTRAPEGKYLVETRSLQPIKKMDNFYIPTATDMQLSATVFEKHSGIHVSYRDRRLSGVMQLAPWHIFNYNGQIYEELLRFEWEYVDCGFPVTAYIACMVCLLKTEADVRLLRANGIIPSMENDENDVLHFVQVFKTLLRYNDRMSDDLDILLKKVRAHHERSASKYYAEFKSHYCPNPWVTISVVAGICLFFLTFIQGVIQSVFGMLSYYKR